MSRYGLGAGRSRHTRGLLPVTWALCLTLWCGASLVGQEGPAYGPSLDPTKALAQYVHRSWTTDDGLPQNSINGIGQTPDGYLWLATMGGVVRFDGFEFTTFSTANSPELVTNRFTTLSVGPAGDLWLGSEGGHLIVLREGRFELVTRSGFGSIYGIAFEDDGTPVYSTSERTWRVPEGKVEVVLEGGGQLVRSDDGAFWVSTHMGLLRWNTGPPQRWDGSEWTGVLERTQGGNQGPASIVARSGGGVWVGGDNLWAQSATSARRVAGLDGFADHVFQDRAGTVWVGVLSDGDLGLARLGDGRFEHLAGSLGPPPNQVSSMFEDREGTLWVGTSASGLHQFVDAPVTAFEVDEGLRGSPAIVIQKAGGDVWLGPDCSAVPVSTAVVFRDGRLSQGDSPPWGAVACPRGVTLDRGGVAWVVTQGALTSSGATRATAIPLPGQGLAVLEDRRGAIWVSAVGGLFRVEEDSLRTVVLSGPSDTTALRVHGLRLGRDGAVLVASTNEGVARILGGQIEWFGTEQGLSDQTVRDVFDAGNGSLWVATYGGGLNRIRDGRITALRREDGFCDDFLSRILDDDEGRLWFNGNAGISYASLDDLEAFSDGRSTSPACTLLGRDDGMKTTEGQWGGGKTADGRLWFPSIRGVSMVDPARLERNPFPPRPVLTAVLAGDATFRGDEIRLDADSRDIEVRYSAVSLRNPARVRFEYRLLGDDPAWIDVGSRRSAFFTDLRPGSYEFQVQARNEDGRLSVAPASLSLSVAPFFHETLPFRGGLIILVMLSAMVGHRLRTRRLHDRVAKAEREAAERRRLENEILEISGEERRRIGQDLHDGLAGQLVGMGYLARAVQSELEAQGLSEGAGHLADLQRHLQEAAGQTRFLSHGMLPPAFTADGLGHALEELATDVQGLYALSCHAHIDPEVGFEDDEMASHLYLIAREAVTNASKHAGAQRVKISLESHDDGLRLSVEDDGVGIARSGGDQADFDREGVGLRIMRYRSSRIGGELEIESQAEGGTVVSCTVPADRVPGGT